MYEAGESDEDGVPGGDEDEALLGLQSSRPKKSILNLQKKVLTEFFQWKKKNKEKSIGVINFTKPVLKI